MNQSIKLIDLSNFKVIPKVRIKIPSQLKTRNLIVRGRPKKIIELNSIKIQGSTIRSIGFSYSERNRKNYSISEIQDIRTPKARGRNERLFKNETQDLYFNDTKLKKIGFSLNQKSNTTTNTEPEYASLKTIIQEIWKKPAKIIEKKRQEFSLHARMRKTQKISSQSFNKINSIIKNLEETNQNVCVQTDFDCPDLDMNKLT